MDYDMNYFYTGKTPENETHCHKKKSLSKLEEIFQASFRHRLVCTQWLLTFQFNLDQEV